MRADHIFSKRERQIMDIIYRRSSATAHEIFNDFPRPRPSLATVRRLIIVLEDKGFLKHVKQSNEYVYSPKIPKEQISASELKRTMDVYFEGSLSMAVAALLDVSDSNLNTEEINRLRRLVKDRLENESKQKADDT